MNSAYDISGDRKSTLVHAAPGGNSSFSLAHDSRQVPEGMTPRELANIRKVRLLSMLGLSLRGPRGPA